MKTCSMHGQMPGNFCSECGEKLQETPNPETASPTLYQVFGENPCPNCGYQLKHGHQQFCPGCGRLLTWLCR